MGSQINGHTDSDGEDNYNLTLSKARAQAVAAFLLERGIASNRFSAHGFGETQALANNETDAGRQLNRRVEFLIVRI